MSGPETGEMSACGPTRSASDVRSRAAIGGIADIKRDAVEHVWDGSSSIGSRSLRPLCGRWRGARHGGDQHHGGGATGACVRGPQKSKAAEPVMKAQRLSARTDLVDRADQGVGTSEWAGQSTSTVMLGVVLARHHHQRR